MTNDTNNQSESSIQRTGLADAVLKRIEAEKIEPTPRWQFFFSECTMWALWMLSIVVGAVAVAVMVYVSVHAGYAFYEATHDTLLSFVIEVAPVLWLSLFIVMAAVAYFNLRHTKKGYKYPFWQILLSSLVLSILGGSLLHLAGGGWVVDTMLARTMPMYSSFEKMERKMWLDPDDGRLVGRFVANGSTGRTVNFVDVEEKNWRVHTDELMTSDFEALGSGKLVKVLGVMGTTSDDEFYGCGVFTWNHEKALGIDEMRRQKHEFLERVSFQAGKVRQDIEEDLENLGAKITGTTTEIMEEREESHHMQSLCPQMPVIKRFLPTPA